MLNRKKYILCTITFLPLKHMFFFFFLKHENILLVSSNNYKQFVIQVPKKQMNFRNLKGGRNWLSDFVLIGRHVIYCTSA